jgi:hypothetical protein
MNAVNIKLIATFLLLFFMCAFDGKLVTAVCVMHIYTHQRLYYVWYSYSFKGEEYSFVGMSVNHSEVFNSKMFQLPHVICVAMCLHLMVRITEHISAKKDANGAIFPRINTVE